MLKVFISYNFKGSGKKLAQRIGTLLQSLGVDAEDGNLKTPTGRLIPQVEKKIKNCDALISILVEGKSQKWIEGEINFARGLGLPVVIIVKGNIKLKGPLADRYYIELTKGEFEVAAELVAAVKEIGLKVGKSGNKDFDKFLAIGMEKVYNRLTHKNIQERLAASSYIKVLKTWFPESDQIADGLEKAIREKQATVELLLCKPESFLLHQRSEGAGLKDWWGSFKVCQAIEDLCKWLEEKPGARVRVALYDSWPGCPVIWYGDKIIMGFYFRGKASPAWPWIHVQKKSRLASILDNQFKQLWEHPDTVHLDSPEQMREWLKQNKKCGEIAARGR